MGIFPENRNDSVEVKQRAGERVRTVDNDVGNVVLYQLSYARIDYLEALYSILSVLQDGAGKHSCRDTPCAE